MPSKSGELLVKEQLQDPSLLPTAFMQAIKGDTGVSIIDIKNYSTTNTDGLFGQPGATDTYRIMLSDGSSKDFKIYNGIRVSESVSQADLTSAVNNALNSLVGAAPDTLNTIQELAEALLANAQDDSSNLTTLLNAIAAKANQADLTSTVTDLSNLTIVVNEHTSNISSLTTTVNGHTASIGNVNTSLTSLTNTVSGHTTSISNLNTTANNLLDVKQNVKSAAYTLALTDRGGSVDTSSNIVIPQVASVAFQIGTTINITNMSSGTITISPDTNVALIKSGTTTTGAVSLRSYGMVVIRCVNPNVWILSGSGVN